MRLFFTLLLISTSYLIQAQSNTTFMSFEEESIALGEVKKGEKREFKFKFTNISDEDIKIDLVSGCDCTTLDWPRLPIKPGKTGYIDVIFDSSEKEDSEPVDVDIYLRNTDPKTGHPALIVVNYTYELRM